MKTLFFATAAFFLTFASASAGPLRHVVLFSFKESASEQSIKEVEDAFAALKGQIDTIKGYEWGTNVSKENRAQGLTHLFFVTFDDQAGLDVYGPHPAHEAFKAKLKGLVDKVLVFDYIAAEG